MPRVMHYEWEGREYDHTPRSADWFWALGIIAVALAIAAGLFGDYLVSFLVLVAAGTLAVHAAKEPRLHRFRIADEGLYIGEELHPWKRMKSFSVLEDIEGELPPLLSIHTEHWLYPHLVIPLEGVDADGVYAHFLRHVDEGEHPHTVTDVVAGLLGF